MVKKELFSVNNKKISEVYSSNNNNNKNNNNNNSNISNNNNNNSNKYRYCNSIDIIGDNTKNT